MTHCRIADPSKVSLINDSTTIKSCHPTNDVGRYIRSRNLLQTSLMLPKLLFPQIENVFDAVVSLGTEYPFPYIIITHILKKI